MLLGSDTLNVTTGSDDVTKGEGRPEFAVSTCPPVAPIGLKPLTKCTPSPALGLGYTVATSRRLRARRFSTMLAHGGELAAPTYVSRDLDLWAYQRGVELVEQSSLSIRRTLAPIGIPRSTFYDWYSRYQESGIEALEDGKPRPRRIWNKIPDKIRTAIVNLALEEFGPVAAWAAVAVAI